MGELFYNSCERKMFSNTTQNSDTIRGKIDTINYIKKKTCAKGDICNQKYNIQGN